MTREEMVAAAKRKWMIEQAKAKYAQETPQEGQAPFTAVEQVQHPDISVKERFIMKNFAADPEKAMAYIRQEHPDMEIGQRGGQIIVKKPTEKKWKVIDPSSLDIQDISDIVADIGAGATEAAAGVGGAVLGAAAGGGVGALPGGMLGAGAAGAATEAARQKVGQWLGIPQEVSGTDVAISGGLSAAMVPLMGTGVGAKELIKGALPGAFQKAAAETTARGLLPMAAGGAYQGVTRGMAPKVAELFTGVPKSQYKTVLGEPEKMAEIALEGEAATAEKSLRGLFDANEAEKKAAAEQINTHIRKSGQQIDITGLKNTLKSAIVKLDEKSKTAGLNKVEAGKLQSLLDMYNDSFTKVVNLGTDQEGKQITRTLEVPNQVDAETIFDMKEVLQDAAKGFTDPMRASKLPSDKAMVTTARGAYHQANEAVDKVIKNAPTLRKKFQETIKTDELITNKFKNKPSLDPRIEDNVFTEKGLQTLQSLDQSKKDALKKAIIGLDKKYGTNVGKTAQYLQAYKNLVAPSLMQSYGAGRVISGGLIGGGIGGLAGPMVLPEGTPFGSRQLTAALGTVIGGAMTGKRAMKSFLKGGLRAEKAAKRGIGVTRLQYIPRGYYGQTAWNLMKDRGE